MADLAKKTKQQGRSRLGTFGHHAGERTTLLCYVADSSGSYRRMWPLNHFSVYRTPPPCQAFLGPPGQMHSFSAPGASLHEPESERDSRLHPSCIHSRNLIGSMLWYSRIKLALLGQKPWFPWRLGLFSWSFIYLMFTEFILCARH